MMSLASASYFLSKRGEMRVSNGVMVSVNTRTLGELLVECVGSGL